MLDRIDWLYIAVYKLGPLKSKQLARAYEIQSTVD